MNNRKSKKKFLYTIEENKTLSFYEDGIYLLNDGITLLRVFIKLYTRIIKLI